MGKELNRLTLNVSGGCNLRCQYCYANAGNYKSKGINMTSSIADKTLLTFLNHFEQVDSIMFFGGEPLLNYSLIEYICEKTLELTQNGKIKPLPKFSLITNGTIYNEKISEILKKYNFAVTVSYDGDIDVNNKLRISQTGQGMSPVIIKNIKKLIDETGIIPSIEATYTRFHVEQGVSPMQVVKNIKEISDKLQVHLVPVMADFSCSYALPDYSPFVNSVSDFFKNVKSLTDCKQNPPVYSLLGRLLFPLIFKGKPPIRHICDAGFGTLSVASNGDIYPCFMFIDTPKFYMGNVENENIFCSDYFKEKQNTILAFSDKQVNAECKKCFASSVCNGCLGHALNSKHELELDQKDCNLTRDMLKETIIGLYHLTHKNI
nr:MULTISPECIES: radical SAM protein [unclassified Treponema]